MVTMPFAAPVRRSYSAFVYPGAGAGANTALLDSLNDVGAPRFTTSWAGTQAATVTLGRAFGLNDGPDQPASTGALANGNRVDIWCHDDWSLTSDDGHLGRLCYRGTIEDIKFNVTRGTTDLTLQSFQRLPAQTAIPAPSALNGDMITIAKGFWQQAGMTALGWDSGNERQSGVSISATIAPGNITLASVLDQVVRAAGGNWHWHVSPQGLLRIVDETERGTTHALSHGGTCTVESIGPSTVSRAKQVIVTYQLPGIGGVGSVTATASDWTQADPRTVYIALPSKMDVSFAQPYADGMLALLDRVTITGRVRVSASQYDIGSINVGDRVNLNVERTLSNAPGWNPDDPLLQSLTVGQIEYAGDDVTLGFGRPTPDLARLVAGNQTWMADVIRQQMYS